MIAGRPAPDVPGGRTSRPAFRHHPPRGARCSARVDARSEACRCRRRVFRGVGSRNGAEGHRSDLTSRRGRPAPGRILVPAGRSLAGRSPAGLLACSLVAFNVSGTGIPSSAHLSSAKPALQRLFSETRSGRTLAPVCRSASSCHSTRQHPERRPASGAAAPRSTTPVPPARGRSPPAVSDLLPLRV